MPSSLFLQQVSGGAAGLSLCRGDACAYEVWPTNHILPQPAPPSPATPEPIEDSAHEYAGVRARPCMVHGPNFIREGRSLAGIGTQHLSLLLVVCAVARSGVSLVKLHEPVLALISLNWLKLDALHLPHASHNSIAAEAFSA